MRIIDTHCHASESWYEPVESLLFQMDRNGVEAAVLVQMNGQFDNDYQFELLRRYPERFASVVLVDASRDDALQRLEQLADRGATGVRLNAATRSPSGDPYAIWRKADELGLSVSCAGNQQQLSSDEFAALVGSLPNLTVVIEHLGGMNGSDPDLPSNPTHAKILALAGYPNAYMKIPGLGECCGRTMPVPDGFPFESDGLPLLRLAREAFGADRLMWGSDYPPVSQREGYANALKYPMEQFASLPDLEREQIFGGTAARVYGLF